MFEVINGEFRLRGAHVSSFRRDGFVKLASFLSLELVQYIKSKIKGRMTLLSEGQNGFKRVGYDIFEDDAVVEALLGHDVFVETLTTLADRSLFFAQGLGFELEKNKHHGFPWHIGTQSFGYQRASDYGCSMWVPLDPIDTAGQGGGMSYVPERIVSGQFMYDHVDPAIDATLAELAKDEQEPLTLQEFIELRHGILNSPAMTKLLDANRRSDDFDLGDVLFFNKRVIHSSEMLTEGPLETRCAFVMRFIGLDARYDKRRAMGLEFPRSYFGHKPQSNFHLDVCREDGEIICESPYFRNGERRRLAMRAE
ncbi:hypothetical protein WMF30_43140 [Sorangium sp. So ce134]